MCQSKAEGGRRCAFHLEQGVTSGLTTYAASITGLTPKQTGEAFDALHREGTHEPDPTREEVDAFLEQQVFRVRHELTLTEKRRESLVNRLRAAIGRITPNGATFYAWKNLVAEAWSRVRRKAAAAFMLGALTFSVGACGNAPDAPTAPDTAAPVSAPHTPGQHANPGVQYDTEFKTAKPQIGADAAEKFGKDGAIAGSKTVVEVAERFFFNENAIAAKPSKKNAAELAYPAGDYMTNDARSDWNAAVTAYVKDWTEDGRYEGTQAGANVGSLCTYGGVVGKTTMPDGRTIEAATSGPVAVNREITSVKTSVEADGRLKVDVTAAADVRVNINGKPKLWHMTRSGIFWMEKYGNDWKIDGFNGTFAMGNMRPDK